MRSLMLALFAFTAGFALNTLLKTKKPAESDVVIEAYDALRTKYLKDIDAKTLFEGAVAGMVASLNDKFISYLPPERAELDRQDIEGEFFGIGVSISPADEQGNGIKVENVYRNSPADKAGVKIGDVILKADDKDLTKLPLNEGVKLLRGPKGSIVELLLLRLGNTLKTKVTRDKIELVDVSSTILPGNIGYVSVATFENRKIEAQLQNVLKNFKQNDVKGIILDLRDNLGGLVDQSVAVSDAFLEKGSIFVTKKHNEGPKVEASARKQPTDYSGPLVVLTNGYTASAAEIVSSALQGNKRAKLVGEKTFGKGVANIVTNLSNGSTINIPFEEWLTPTGEIISNKGINPDFFVKDTRFENPLIIQGINALPNSRVEISVNGKKIDALADSDGKFSYQQTIEQKKVQPGEAIADLTKDLQLKKAFELIKSN